jgi:Ca2+-binding EF-hand superfamily protein
MASEAQRRQRVAVLTKAFDSDGDGKLSEAEVQAMVRLYEDASTRRQLAPEVLAVLEAYDANHDARLDSAEVQALMADVSAARMAGYGGVVVTV